MHDQIDVVDVDAAGGDIGRDQHPRVAGGEAGQSALALVLVQVAVDRRGRSAGIAELASEPVSAVLGAHEEQAAGRTAGDLQPRPEASSAGGTTKTRWSASSTGALADATAWIPGSVR